MALGCDGHGGDALSARLTDFQPPTSWHTAAMDENDGAAVRIPPPLVYLGAVILGIVAHAYIAPLPGE